MTGMLMSKSTRPGNLQSKGASVCHDAQLLTRWQAVRCQAGCEDPASSPAVQCRPASAGTSGLNMLLVFLRKGCRVSCPGRSGRRRRQLDAGRRVVRDLGWCWGHDMQVLHLVQGSTLQPCKASPVTLILLGLVLNELQLPAGLGVSSKGHGVFLGEWMYHNSLTFDEIFCLYAHLSVHLLCRGERLQQALGQGAAHLAARRAQLLG